MNSDTVSYSFWRVHLGNYFCFSFETVDNVPDKADGANLTKWYRGGLMSFRFFWRIHAIEHVVVVHLSCGNR